MSSFSSLFRSGNRCISLLAVLVFVFLCFHVYTLGLYLNRHLFLPFMSRRQPPLLVAN